MRLIVVGPSYDELTTLMVGWLTEVVSCGIRCQPLLGEEAVTDRLRAELSIPSEAEFVVVFYGHGLPDALLTAPGLSGQAVTGDARHGVLCRVADLPRQRRIDVVAYCCWSALGLGVSLRKRDARNRFLGFRGDIPFIRGGRHRREEAFRRPMHGVVVNVVDDGLQHDDWLELIRAYKQEYDRWYEGGEFADDPKALLVCGFLEEHAIAVDQRV